MAGRHITDHSSFAGMGSAKSVLPIGNKVQTHSDAGDASHLSSYEDTDMAIKHQQSQNVAKAKSKPMKPTYRN